MSVFELCIWIKIEKKLDIALNSKFLLIFYALFDTIRF